MAILEDDENLEEDGDEDAVLEAIGKESMDEDEEDMTSFGGSSHAAMEVANGSAGSVSQGSTASSTSTSSSNDLAMAEIFTQEYKARNRVREIKKMRQYF